MVRKALVELEAPPMAAYRQCRDHWALHDCFRAPGPTQFQGHSFADAGSITLALEINGGEAIKLT